MVDLRVQSYREKSKLRQQKRNLQLQHQQKLKQHQLQRLKKQYPQKSKIISKKIIPKVVVQKSKNISKKIIPKVVVQKPKTVLVSSRKFHDLRAQSYKRKSELRQLKKQYKSTVVPKRNILKHNKTTQSIRERVYPSEQKSKITTVWSKPVPPVKKTIYQKSDKLFRGYLPGKPTPKMIQIERQKQKVYNLQVQRKIDKFKKENVKIKSFLDEPYRSRIKIQNYFSDSGCYYSKDKTIALNPIDRYIPFWGKGILRHEIGHAVHHKMKRNLKNDKGRLNEIHYKMENTPVAKKFKLLYVDTKLYKPNQFSSEAVAENFRIFGRNPYKYKKKYPEQSEMFLKYI